MVHKTPFVFNPQSARSITWSETKTSARSCTSTTWRTSKPGKRPVQIGRLQDGRNGHRKIAPLLVGIPLSARVLDLGCGSGDLLSYLNRYGFRLVEGVDVSEEQVELARSRGLDASVADAMQTLRNRVGDYDLITAFDVLEHFSKGELLRLMEAVRSALRPNGVFIAQTPNGEGLLPGHVIHSDLTHLTILTPESLEHLLRRSGFGRCEFFETGPVPKNFAGVVRSVLWSIVRAIAIALRVIETGRSQKIWTENMICKAIVSAPTMQARSTLETCPGNPIGVAD